MKAENFTEELMELGGTKIRVTLYRIGDEYHCHIYNVDPGATIARASAPDRNAAREEALSKAKKRLLKNASDS